MRLVQLAKKGLLFLACMGLISCSKTKDPGVVEEIKLSNGGIHATFLLPVAYQAEVTNNHLVHFRMRYPSLSAVPQSAYPGNDEIGVYMTLLNNPLSRAEMIMSEAKEHADSDRPGQYFRAEKKGIYEIFQQLPAKNESPRIINTFIFKSYDGNFVAVTDTGSSTVVYVAERKIGANLRIKYLISKLLGQDFIRIDEVVSEFVRIRLTDNSN